MLLFCATPLSRVAAMIGVGWLLASLALPVTATPVTPSFAPALLQQALASAWQKHPTATLTDATLAAARARADAADQPLYNPEIELDADREGVDRITSAKLSLTLDLNGKRRVRGAAATARVDQVTAEAQVRRRDFAKQWLAGWAELRTAQQRVSTGERRLALVTRFAGLAEKQFAADDISGLERDLALLARDEAEAEQSLLVADQAEAESRFRVVGGMPEAVAGVPLPSDSLPAPGEIHRGVDASPDWHVAQAAVLVAEREIAVAKRNRMADPTLGLRGGRVDYGDVRDDIVGVSITIPMFVRNSYHAEVVAAEADADVAAADLARVRMELENEQRRAIDSYTAAQAAWTRWSRSRGTDIDRRAALLEKMWREGELSTADYLMQLNQTLDTALAGAELEARLWRGFTDYLASTGQLERWSGLDGTP